MFKTFIYCLHVIINVSLSYVTCFIVRPKPPKRLSTNLLDELLSVNSVQRVLEKQPGGGCWFPCGRLTCVCLTRSTAAPTWIHIATQGECVLKLVHDVMSQPQPLSGGALPWRPI